MRDSEQEIIEKDSLSSLLGQIAHKKFDEAKERELIDLLERQVFLQGAICDCLHCGTSKWYVVDDLASQIRCDGCFTLFPLPPAPKWSLCLNGLVSNALSKDGTLAVLQALYHLKRESNEAGMFLYLPCQDIFKVSHKGAYTDPDVVVIQNGKFKIGEVKSNAGGFKADDFEKLEEVGTELLPDEIIVAAPGENWPSEVQEEISRLKETLAQFDVKVNQLSLVWR